MGVLKESADAVRAYRRKVEESVRATRADAAKAAATMERWNAAVAAVPETETLTGMKVPTVALPFLDEAGAVARYLGEEGLPGQYPFTQSAFPTMYLIDENDDAGEEPTRMFAGLGLPEDTNERFKFLTRNQRSKRLSTAFDGVTLYGMDADEPGVLGKVGEGGVSISTIDDMERLYDGFDLQSPETSVSMTINGPAPILMAQLVGVAARQELKKRGLLNGKSPDGETYRKIRAEAAANMRGTVQADIFKEVQAQNETLFPLAPSLRLLADMVDYSAKAMPRWYPISVSGYHIAEAGATPIEQIALTVGNGLAYVDLFHQRGMDLEKVVPRLSFFFCFDHDIESSVIGRVARRAWAVAMRERYGLSDRACKLKFHAQTSGRSLTESGLLNNITRTAAQLFLSLVNSTNSAHSNSYDEAITTPTAEAAKVASDTQAMLLEETGLFRHMMGLFSASPGLRVVTDRVEAAVMEMWDEMDRVGGVVAAIEQRYARARIQDSFYRLQENIRSGRKRVVGVNCYVNPDEKRPVVELSRTPRDAREAQAERSRAFKRANERPANEALGRLREAAALDDKKTNVFERLLDAVEVATLGQIVHALQDEWGRFRPMI
jgi:methylmalonyl-CoA mutase cobalamin-binding domain/chain